MVQFKVAMFLAILTGMPIIVHQLAKFVAPGLYQREKQTIAKITIPATALFAMGVLFAYFWILPFTFEFLYGVGLRMGLTTVVGPNQFFDVALLFFVGLGLAFQIPVFMWGLTALGIVEPGVWKKYWRVALVAFFFFGAAITPDGSGITMMFVAVPMSVLYAVGYVLSNRKWRIGHEPEQREERRRSSFAVWSVVIVVVVALAGGVLYYNRGLFASPLEISEKVIATGNLQLHVPAFVLYSPNAFDPGISTGVVLKVTNETAVDILWSAAALDGRKVGFVNVANGQSPILPGEDGSRTTIFPALWNASDIQALTLTITDGRSYVYALELDMEYRLVLEQVFSDANRNGLLDSGERVEEELYIIEYGLSAGGVSLVSLDESGVSPPIPEQLNLFSKGIFQSAGPSWSLESSIAEVDTANMTFQYTMWITDPSLEEHGVSLFLTRTFLWSGEDHRIWVLGDISAQFVYLWSLDLRFGAIYPLLESP